MIHHVSIPARDVGNVARVLSELTGWQARPFLGPLRGAMMLLAGDDHGTGIEIYPDGAVLVPSEGETQVNFGHVDSPTHLPFHLLLSLDTDRATVQQIGEREGWRTLNCWRGPPGQPVFELIEFWVENRVMIEIATPDMLANYVHAASAAGHDEVSARIQAARAVA